MTKRFEGKIVVITGGSDGIGLASAERFAMEGAQVPWSMTMRDVVAGDQDAVHDARELPWLILDDPVQSMDDVHIAHFAALLRTLSKEHGRQVMIAVHDRQLFEYLRLELSPSTLRDSLITLELSRGPRRDTICRHERLAFREETALAAA